MKNSFKIYLTMLALSLVSFNVNLYSKSHERNVLNTNEQLDLDQREDDDEYFSGNKLNQESFEFTSADEPEEFDND
jgi:hypothetical protein